MSPEQYDRWKDFAIRAARTWFRRSRRPDTKWIVAAVEDFFDCLPDEDVVCYRNWDRSEAYPEGHKHHRVERWCRCDCRYQVGSEMPYVMPGCKQCCGKGKFPVYAHPYGIGDTYTEWETGYIHLDDTLLNQREDDRLDSLRQRGKYTKADALHKAITERYSNPVCCCIRAGMDVASEQSGGVLGYTAGDIRRMYPKGVPDWIARQWDDAEEIREAAVAPGVGFIPQVVGPSPRFEQMADTAGVWL